MKYLSYFLLFFPSAVFGQFTLNSSYNYQTGTTYRSYEYRGNNITTPSSGPEQEWDYTGLMLRGSYDNEVVPNSNTSYPSANITVRTNHSPAREFYYQTGESEMLNWGYRNTDIGDANYSGNDGQMVLSYPMYFGDPIANDNISGTGRITVGGFPLTTNRTGTVTIEVDAYGSLKLPVNEYENCVRIKQQIQLQDSHSSFFANFNANTTIDLYYWYAVGVNYPVFTLAFSDTQISGSFGNDNIKDTIVIENGPVPMGINKSQAYQAVSVFPNPAKNNFTVQFHSHINSFSRFSLTNLAGNYTKELGERNIIPGQQYHSFNIPDLPPGLYFLKMQSDKGFSVVKLEIY
ncbi:MAG: T9SS type A sorting domain-containing protein [Cytophagaceae bacterium]